MSSSFVQDAHRFMLACRQPEKWSDEQLNGGFKGMLYSAQKNPSPLNDTYLRLCRDSYDRAIEARLKGSPHP